MQEPLTTTHVDAVCASLPRRRWIDVAIVATGVTAIASGWAAVGAIVVAFGLVMPLVHWTRRRDVASSVRHLVPPEVARAHADVLAAARLPGVPDPTMTAASADDVLVEVAAVLGGRPPRGAAHRRFVAARVAALQKAASELRDWHESWVAAQAELDLIDPKLLPQEAPSARRGGVLTTVLVIVLFPAFLLWDAARGIGRGAISALDGLALRVRTAARLVVRAGRFTASMVVDATRRWTDVRDRILAAAREARARFVAGRVRLRAQTRLARRRAARSG